MIEKAPEEPADRIDALATVGALVGLGQPSGRQELAEEQFEVEQAVLAEGLNPAAEGGGPGAEGGKERGGH